MSANDATPSGSMVAVFGAGGRLGRCVTAELLERGFRVLAFVHIHNPLPSHRQLSTVQGDIHDAQAVAGAVAQADAVVATLGSANAPVKDIVASGVANITAAMQKHGKKRLVSTTGSAARQATEIGREHSYLAFRREQMLAFVPDLLLDGERHLDILERSGLDWTAVRAPRMLNGRLCSCRLSATPPHPTTTMPYAAAAKLLVAELVDGRWIGEAPFVSGEPPER